MVTVGEQLRKTRKSIGLSQKEMADGIVSVSSYSRVENDLSTISATGLVQLLSKHDLSIIEFLQDFGDIEPHNLFFERKISSAFLKQDATELKKIKADPKLNNQLARDVIDLILSRLGENTDGDLKRKQVNLKHTLLRIDEWDASYLWLFLNVMDLYSFSDLEDLINSIYVHYRNRCDYSNAALKIFSRNCC